MSKPRTAAEIQAWHNRGIDEITEEEWNEAARWADAHWADRPWERNTGAPDHDHLKSLGFGFDGRGDPIWKEKE